MCLSADNYSYWSNKCSLCEHKKLYIRHLICCCSKNRSVSVEKWKIVNFCLLLLLEWIITAIKLTRSIRLERNPHRSLHSCSFSCLFLHNQATLPIRTEQEQHFNTCHTTLTTSKREYGAALDSRVFTETASQTPRAPIMIKGESLNVFKVSPWKWTDADALSAWATCNRPQCGANSHSTRPQSFIKPLHWTLGSKLGVWVHHSAGTVQA